MTNKGYDNLTKELKFLKLDKRPLIVIAIEEARQLGDLKENAEYHAAKEDKVNIDKKIAELEDIVSRAIIIDPSTLQHDKISFGSTIKLIDIDTEEEIIYTITGSQESNPKKGFISFNSPLAKQLLGKEEGDEVTVKLPNGEKGYEVLEIFYKDDL